MENHLSLFSSIGLLTEAPLWNEGRLREKRCPTAGILSGCYSLGIFLKSQAAKARGSACLSFHWKAKYFCLLSAEQHSTCCVPAALEARRQRNWPCNFCLISLLFEGSTVFWGDVCWSTITKFLGVSSTACCSCDRLLNSPGWIRLPCSWQG